MHRLNSESPIPNFSAYGPHVAASWGGEALPSRCSPRRSQPRSRSLPAQTVLDWDLPWPALLRGPDAGLSQRLRRWDKGVDQRPRRPDLTGQRDGLGRGTRRDHHAPGTPRRRRESGPSGRPHEAGALKKVPRGIFQACARPSGRPPGRAHAPPRATAPGLRSHRTGGDCQTRPRASNEALKVSRLAYPSAWT